MGRIESLQRKIQQLSPDELAELRDRFLDLDWMRLDAQLEQDVRAGRLDALADCALRDHAAGKSIPL